MTPTVGGGDLRRILASDHHDPFGVLGIHPHRDDGRPAVVVRAFQPTAREVFVLRRDTGSRRRMKRVHQDGFFELVFLRRQEPFPYELELRHDDGTARITPDPYAFQPLMGDLDLQLLGEGNHFRSHEKLGAHVRTVGEVRGTHFAVWAPNARRVSVVGNFNGWDGRVHPMRSLGATGIWELFLPGVGHGELYKFEVRSRAGDSQLKSDPHAYFSEKRPDTASIVWDLEAYEWEDADWMASRAAQDPLTRPVSIYEVHLGSWARVPEEENRWLSYPELAERLGDYLEELGYTHVELLPITEHPHDGSWGYQCMGYFAPTSRFGSPDEFKALVDSLHKRGIGVILDWVPAHFPKDAHGLARFDGTALYEYADPQKGEHKDWGTLIFNYARNEVRNFLLSSALFWLDHYHLDGLRVDAVASMLYLDYSREEGEWAPNEQGGRENLEAISFLKRLNELCHGEHPGVMMFAEESTTFPKVSHPTSDGGLGFTFKWNMGWMHDTLSYIGRAPIHRRYHHDEITFGLMYAFTEHFVLPISHDEVVHMKGSLLTKMPGDYWQRFANLRLYLAFMWTMPGKKLLFMGCELGQWNEWNDHQSVDWNLLDYPAHRQLRHFVAELNKLYAGEPALYEKDAAWDGFAWLRVEDSDNSTLAWVRRAADPDDHVVVACNFTPMPRDGYQLGVPRAGSYRVLANSDGPAFHGSGAGSTGTLEAVDEPLDDQPASLTLTLPPLGALILKPV
jgi:1,4-alpha-glucan branching enzyme